MSSSLGKTSSYLGKTSSSSFSKPSLTKASFSTVGTVSSTLGRTSSSAQLAGYIKDGGDRGLSRTTSMRSDGSGQRSVRFNLERASIMGSGPALVAEPAR